MLRPLGFGCRGNVTARLKCLFAATSRFPVRGSTCRLVRSWVRNFSVRSGWFSAGAAVRFWQPPFQRSELAFSASRWRSASRCSPWPMPSATSRAGHFNPAVTFGVWAGGRFPASEIVPYWIAQLVGAIAACAVLYVIASGKAGFELSAGFAANGYGEHSPGGYSLVAALVAEIVLTSFFLIVILGRDRSTSAAWICTAGNRPGADADSPDRHSHNQHLGESRTQHGPSVICRRMGAGATLAVLGRPAHRRRARRIDLPLV